MNDAYQLGYDEGYLDGLAENGNDKIAGWGKVKKTGEYYCTNCKQIVVFRMKDGHPMLYPRCPYCGAMTGVIRELTLDDGRVVIMRGWGD